MPPAPPESDRRQFLAGASGATGLLMSTSGKAAATTPQDGATMLDALAIDQLIHRERHARDAGLWDVMRASYHPDAYIDVSWFQGGGAEFVERSRMAARPGNFNFHQLGTAVAEIRGDRAIAVTPCTLQGFMSFGGVEVNMIGHVNLYWRAAKSGGAWLIAGLRVVYLRDVLIPCNPGEHPELDDKRLASYRPSFRYLSYMLAAAGHPPKQDLPGADRPETVEALRSAEAAWLAGA